MRSYFVLFTTIIVGVGIAFLSQVSSVATSVTTQQDLSRIEFESDGITLVGQVQLPSGEGPFPAVAIVHGSGRTTRNGSGGIASQLLNAGIAVLRYDKRGVGESGGTYFNIGPSNSASGLRVLAQDALAAAQFLSELDVIDTDKIGLFGNSQAGWIIPIASAQSDLLAFSVILVGPAVSVGEEIFYSNLTGENPSNLTDERLDEISQQLVNFSGLRGFDPRESIEDMNNSSLWVLGGRDASIPTRETVTILEDIKTTLDKDFTIEVYPTGTHGLVDVNTGRPLPFMTLSIEWIRQQLESSND
jgi:hypothetical protein